MNKRKENPRYNVISVRLSNKEADQLDRIVNQGGAASRSEILRYAMDNFVTIFKEAAPCEP